MQANVFCKIPNELKTVEIDVEKRIFNINGVPFGANCTEFTLTCEARKGYDMYVRMGIKSEIAFTHYDKEGKKQSDPAL